MVLALPLDVDGVIFEGLLKGVVHKSLAFLLRKECCLRRVIDGGGGLRTFSLGGPSRGCFVVARTVGAKCWNLLIQGLQLLELANLGTTKSNVGGEENSLMMLNTKR